MTNLLGAIQAGISASEAADRNNASIEGVFAELEASLKGIDQQLSVRLKPLNFIESVEIPMAAPRFSHHSVDVMKGTASRRLCVLSRSLNGFPCGLTVEKTTLKVPDIAALRASLAEILATTQSGNAIRAVINHAVNASDF